MSEYTGEQFQGLPALDAIPIAELPYGPGILHVVDGIAENYEHGRPLHIAQLVRSATGEPRLTGTDFQDFIETLNAEPRIQKIGNGFYAIDMSDEAVDKARANMSSRNQVQAQGQVLGEVVITANSFNEMIRLWHKHGSPSREDRPAVPRHRRHVHYKRVREI